MSDYTVTSTPDQDEALAWVAQQADPPLELNDYVKQHAVGTAVAPVDDVAVAYAGGTSAQQAQVAQILGVEATKPA